MTAPQFNPTSATARNTPTLKVGSLWVDTFGKAFKVTTATRSWVSAMCLGHKREMGLSVFMDNMIPIDERLEMEDL